jgi:hypothetical protein
VRGTEFDLRAIFGEAYGVMNSRFLLPGLAVLALTTGAFAETGPVTMVSLTNSPTPTPAPPPAAAPSATSTPPADPAPKPAATPDKKTSSPDPAPAPAAAPASTAAAPAPAPAPATAPSSPVAKASGALLDKFISDLSDAVKLSDDDKKEIQSYYQADGPTLQKILNDPSLSPLQQADQVADLRDKRDAKIDTLLQDPARQHEFYEVEAGYRVALTEAAADGGLSPAPPAPAGAPSAPAAPSTPTAAK